MVFWVVLWFGFLKIENLCKGCWSFSKVLYLKFLKLAICTFLLYWYIGYWVRDMKTAFLPLLFMVVLSIVVAQSVRLLFSSHDFLFPLGACTLFWTLSFSRFFGQQLNWFVTATAKSLLKQIFNHLFPFSC